jgi:hypothetical protein
MSESLAKYYKDGKEPFVVFDYAAYLRDKLNALQKEVERSLQKRMVALRGYRLIEDITQVRHPQPVKDSWKVSGGTLYVTFVPGKRVRAYRTYRLNDGRHVFVETLSEMSL